MKISIDNVFYSNKVQSGWRLDYCAAAENSTYCPEDFDEFFKQRRRWIPSTLANQLLLLQVSVIAIEITRHFAIDK